MNNPEANRTSFTSDGFFRTGDQGKQDEDGYVIITGRIKELINKGGEKISPVEVDNVVAQNSAVAEAVCFAVADEMYGQEVGLAVVLKDGRSINADELQRWIAERVAKFKVPKKVCNDLQGNTTKMLTSVDFFHTHHAQDSDREDSAENGCECYAETAGAQAQIVACAVERYSV